MDELKCSEKIKYDDDLHLTHDDDMAGSNKWFQLWRIGVSV